MKKRRVGHKVGAQKTMRGRKYIWKRSPPRTGRFKWVRKS